jgi:plastocyanin
MKFLALALALTATYAIPEVEQESFDLELEIDGKRELFSLTPGTKCPVGHKCHARHARVGVSPMMATLKEGDTGMSPMMSILKDNLESPLTAPETWHQLNSNLNTAVDSPDHCKRRSAMARAAGLAMGMALGTVNNAAFAAETKTVKMGADSGTLVFEPNKLKICKGDTVSWVINKAGPHNVVFDEEDVPAGVKVEDISMDGQIGEEGETFSKTFNVVGNYGYYCEPHRSAGMQAQLTVA